MLSVVGGIALGIFLVTQLYPLQPTVATPSFLPVERGSQESMRIIPTFIPNVTLENYTVSLKVPAVDNEGNGVITTLKVQARPGEGRVLVNIKQLSFWIDTQHSIRVAKKVAEAYTNVDTSRIDLIYSVETEASLVEGESAGAALTIATIAALKNITLREDVVITGTIQEDGSIGKVGGVIEKCKAAKESGATLFLVPEGQGVYKEYVPEVKCKEYRAPGFYQKVCTSTYELKEVNIGKECGIEVKEVSNVEEALKYFAEE